MSRSYQITLFGSGAGKGYLFDKKLLERYLDEHSRSHISDEEQNLDVIQNWVVSIEKTKAKESSLESRFINDILCRVLGYTSFPAVDGTTATVYNKPSTRITHIDRTPDAVLGEFTSTETRFTVAVELKTPGTDLDLPQPGYGNETPVAQGFYYGRRILGVRWIIVTDMRVLRLYSVESTGEYEEVDLRDCLKSNKLSGLAFRKLWFLFHHNCLVQAHDNSQIHALYLKSAGQQVQIRESFYEVYYQIRLELFSAISEATGKLIVIPEREQVLEATQRLLDRMLFIYYCEDHPQQLIPNGTVARVTAAASNLPGSSQCKVYTYLKELFREIDVGSPPGSDHYLSGYNGELFKMHSIIDQIDLPDSLHKKIFSAHDPHGEPRLIRGVWGLYEYDFWTELNEHLLGHIFEESLSDLNDIGKNKSVNLADKLRERKRNGVFYTSSILSDFLSESALSSILREFAPIHLGDDLVLESLQHRMNKLTNLRVVDFACGSGAFLVSVYRKMLQEYWQLRESIDFLTSGKNVAPDMFKFHESTKQASLLRDCLAGADLLPQAVEIAKLALWLR